MTSTKGKGEYVPDRGDIVWVQLGPTAGHEQSGRRPAIVISPSGYNARAGLALMCPITSISKGYPFEVQVPKTSNIQGVILSDHLRSVDWRARRCELAGKVTPTVIQDVVAKVNTLLS